VLLRKIKNKRVLFR